MESEYPGSSASMASMSECRNRAIILESVFACERANQTLPSVSMAVIIEILGDTRLRIVFPLPSLLVQALLMKLVSFTHVSSMFRIRRLCCSISSIFIPYYCLSISALSELAWWLSFLALIKLRWSSFFITEATIFRLTSTFSVSLTCWQTWMVLSMVFPSYIIDSTVVVMSFLRYAAYFSCSLASQSFCGYFFDSTHRLQTRCCVTRYLLAISF